MIELVYFRIFQKESITWPFLHFSFVVAYGFINETILTFTQLTHFFLIFPIHPIFPLPAYKWFNHTNFKAIAKLLLTVIIIPLLIVISVEMFTIYVLRTTRWQCIILTLPNQLMQHQHCYYNAHVQYCKYYACQKWGLLVPLKMIFHSVISIQVNTVEEAY